MSHAIGLPGTPSTGHRTSARVNASWTQSSASSLSPVSRVKFTAM